MPVNNAKKNYKYLNWDAKSIAEKLQFNLIEEGTFVDQIFPGSNLNILIDLLGAYFEMMGYNINHAASEAMFADSQFYENMNRLVKILRYNPKGFTTSNVLMDVTLRPGANIGTHTQTWVIPKYTTIVGRGIANKLVHYSFIHDYMITIEDGRSLRIFDPPILYNGVWKLYPLPFNAIGNIFETFILENLDSNLVAYPLLNIFVKNHATGKIEEFETITNLYQAGPKDKKCEIRINERRRYEIKFGDDINGTKLNQDDLVYITYLQSEGPNGRILVKQFDNVGGAELKIIGLNDTFIKENLIPQHNRILSEEDLVKLEFTNYQASTEVLTFETVDQIREHAPDAFRTQGTLVVETDYKNYIMNNLSQNNGILDVSVQNNFNYMTDFMGWLYQYNKLSQDIRYFNYSFATSCDFNNVYLWLKSNNDYYYNVSDSSKNIIKNECDKYKPTTAELVLIDPLLMKFAPFVSRQRPINPDTREFISYSDFIFHDLIDNDFHYIDIKRDLNSFVTKEQIYNQAFNLFVDFFKNSNNKLGQIINIQDLYNRLMNIDGVKEVSTVFDPKTNKQNIIRFEGLSMAAWTDALVLAEDFTVINGTIKLRPFQFPRFFDLTKLSQLIKVTSDNYTIGNVVL